MGINMVSYKQILKNHSTQVGLQSIQDRYQFNSNSFADKANKYFVPICPCGLIDIYMCVNRQIGNAVHFIVTQILPVSVLKGFCPCPHSPQHDLNQQILRQLFLLSILFQKRLICKYLNKFVSFLYGSRRWRHFSHVLLSHSFLPLSQFVINQDVFVFVVYNRMCYNNYAQTYAIYLICTQFSYWLYQN